ncbi:MAG: heparan-alpha-glucosaminide N-acetyltransferase domain-containing protein [Gemmatimonadota bacterium]|uniref:acyltransferase family protein n=1 Tax=Candidatus Palauibacter scopulicola TaxID=3056741 RepID=UPI0023A32EAF|nr:heparan-alpha-glucosaminide N-acetyltransferase domain-containing protein [Candidatus Palauibacter scopulicola]MDE2664258.1 heparan-alpha-glucosaminide N-acetyltransferase domain-containing protein [Candidatus Palauibacter scopulicola]
MTGPTGGRVVSLDAFRGLTIAAMILVNNPGSWAYVYAPLAHAQWHGWTPTDLIFPYFLFIVGVALPFSFSRRLAEGAGRGRLFRHVVRRSLILIGLGLAMRAIPDFDLFDMRLYGVLQRIGLVYCAAAALYLWGSARVRWIAVGVLLLGYWALVAGDLTPDGNLGARIDRFLMGDRLWQGTWDPEGLLSTLPAIGTCLLGIFCGEWLRSDRSGGEISRGMWIIGAWLVVLGFLWDTVFPINKNLWSSSYVLFTAGTALLLFGAMYWLIDVKRLRGAWVTPLVIYGMNSIAVFVASGMFAKTLARIRVGGDGGVPLSAWLYEHAFRSWAGDYGGSLAMAWAQVTFWLGIMWLLHRRGTYIKI